MSRRRADRFEHFEPTGDLGEGTTLLEASAGTGKTYQITSLALRLVAEHGVRLPDILVVTFTRAATSELRDRVRRRLVAGIAALERALAEPDWDPGDQDDEVLAHVVRSGRAGGEEELRLRLGRLVRAREEFDDATIATIHGFCQETLRHSAFESDVDLEAELVEDLSELLEEIVHDFIVRELRSADDDWYAHLRAHGVDRGDLLALAGKLEAEPHLHVLPADPIDAPQQVWAATVARFRATWRDHGAEAVAWLRAQASAGGLNAKKEYREELEDKVRALEEWCEHGIGARFASVWADSKWFTTEELRKRTEDEFLDNPVFRAVDDLRELGGAPATAFKVRFARHVGDELTRRKRVRNVLSFNDLLRALRDGLAGAETREALHAVLTGRFEAALIDEFQDTDPVQWAIFDTVFGAHGHLYLIGDPKQAIYAFRGADVHTYLEAASSIDDQRTLATNWRSDAPYVDALNRLFESGDDRPGEDGRGVLGHPEIPYIAVDAAPPNQQRRLFEADGATATLEFVHVPRALADTDATKPIIKDWTDRELPGLVAADIAAFLTSGARIDPKDEDGERVVLPRDVAVLTRTNAQARSVQEALRAVGVHAVASGGGSVFESFEAAALQRVLTGVLRPHVDRDAKAALTTPLLGVDGGSLAGMTESEWERWIEALAGWSATWRDHGVSEMARHVFDEAGVRARLVELPSGERRLTNVLHLLELLHDAEQADQLGPSALIAWLGDRRADPPANQDATEIRLESDEDAATVVTVHRAKGLEYPVVWCPYLWETKLLFRRENRNLRLHDPDRDGALSIHVGVETPKPDLEAIACQERWEEALRLLYVALTRARHRCTVHWGALRGFGRSPLGHVLHGWEVTDADDPAVTDDELRARLEEVADASDGTIAVRTAAADAAVYSPPAPAVDELHERRLTRGLDRRWQRTSFSRLTREPGERHAADTPGAERDVDADTEPGLREVAARGGVASVGADTESPEVPLAGFPRGPAAGTFLHDVLERLDFTRAEDDLDELLADQLLRHAVEVDDEVPVAEGLRAVLGTPLGPATGGTRLADIGTADRLVELDFDLPLIGGYDGDGGADLRLDRLADVLERHADEVALLGRYAPVLRGIATRPARGFLTGSIDLVFRADVDGHDRYFVADHKSNWLGHRGATRAADRSTAAHYHPDALADAMVEHHYVLQALLYLVGLHRLLRWRLGGAYDYDTHVGGALYLFLRGMIGPDTPVADGGQPHGVLALELPGALVAELDTLLARGEVVR